MSESIDELLREIRQLSKYEDDKRTELDYVQPMIQLITRCFITSLSDSISKSLHHLIWKTMKEMIKKVGNEPTDITRTNMENAFNLCMGWLTNLALCVQRHYDVTFKEAPTFLTVSPSLRMHNSRDATLSEARTFEGFCTLRLGDLMRYKSELSLAASLYLCSSRALPMVGDAWNQLGVLATSRGDPVQSLYYHYRAIHCKNAFLSGSTNIQNILNKYVDREINHMAPFNEKYVSFIAKCHFLRRIPSSLVDDTAFGVDDVTTLIPLLSLHSDLGDSDDEKRAKRLIESVVRLAVRRAGERILEMTSLSSMWFLYAVAVTLPLCICVPDEVIEKLKKDGQRMKDTEMLSFFTIIPGPIPNNMSSEKLGELLQRYTDENQTDQGSSSFVESQSDASSDYTDEIVGGPDVLELECSSDSDDDEPITSKLNRDDNRTPVSSFDFDAPCDI